MASQRQHESQWWPCAVEFHYLILPLLRWSDRQLRLSQVPPQSSLLVVSKQPVAAINLQLLHQLDVREGIEMAQALAVG